MAKVFLLSVFLLSAALSCYAAEGAPQIEEASDPNTWDFGKVKQGDVVEHEFVFKNVSQKPINIKNVTSSCGCTVSEIKERSLDPGGSAPLKVKFNSKGYSGQIKQFIYVLTDDVDNSVTRFIIEAEVEK